jgi:RND family efflux transporter MFP subunit
MTNPEFGRQNSARWRPSGPGMRLALLVLGTILALVVAGQLISRNLAQAELDRRTQARAVPVVGVVSPILEPATINLTLPGTTRALVEASLFARTSGYVRKWTTDIGGRVTKGQVLAEIETPEIDEQLRQAQADLNAIEANAALAKATAERWKTLGQTGSASRQAVDEKLADANAKAAQAASARANVARLRQLQLYQLVSAPFDGVITARKVDVGSLINAGSGAGSEMFRLADISKIRVFVQVPQASAALIQSGIKAELKASDQPGRVFLAEVVRNAEAIDPATRSLLVELQAANDHNMLFAGAHVEVLFHLPVINRKLAVPVNTLLFRPEGPMVALFTAPDSNGLGSVSLKPVQIGLDFGAQVEIVSGLMAEDRIILNPADSIFDGQKVRLAPPAS